MDSGGPYVNAALICERVLQERDGVLSAVRIIDRITLSVTAPQGGVPDAIPPGVASFTLLVVLKAGVFKGSAPLNVFINAPSGKKVAQLSTDVFFEGDDRGINIVAPMQLPISEDGLYWIDVRFADQPLTRIPLRVIYQRLSQGTLSWPSK